MHVKEYHVGLYMIDNQWSLSRFQSRSEAQDFAISSLGDLNCCSVTFCVVYCAVGLKPNIANCNLDDHIQRTDDANHTQRIS